MADEPNVIDELERRLVASFYGPASRSARWPAARAWRVTGAVAALAAVVAVVVLLLPGGGVAPSRALAALTRAARASERGPDSALGPGEEWYVKIVVRSELPMALPPKPGQPLTPSSAFVDTILRGTRDVWVSRDGTFTQRDSTRSSFVNPIKARGDGVKLPRPQTMTHTTPGHGLLASPLSPVPLFSYAQLRALPTEPAKLLRVIAGVQAKLNARAQAQATPTTTAPTTTTIRHGGSVTVESSAQMTVVGRCCGTTSVDRQAVSDLNTIAGLLTMPVPAKVRAALYRTAAALPGVTYDGTARDSLGRSGTEISVGSGDDTMRMIFDQRTGALLAASSEFGATAATTGFGPLVETIAVAKVVKRR